MDTFIIAVLSISIFFLSYSWFLAISRNTLPKVPSFFSFIKQPVSPVLVLGSIFLLIIYFMFQTQTDAIIPLPIYTPILFILSCFVFLGLSKHIHSNKIQYLILLAIALLNTLFLPSEINITEGLIPPLAEKIILALIWSLFAFMYFTLNGVEGIVSLQSLSVCLGLMVLFAIGMLPTLSGFYYCLYIALFVALMFFTEFPTKITLSTDDCRIIGFIIGWLGILATLEGCGSCFIILSMYYIYETCLALLKRISPQPQFKILTNNTFYARLADAGISPQNICRFISRINLVMIFLACFQIYAPNNYTIIIVSVFMIFWMITKVTSSKDVPQRLLLTSSLIALMKKNKNSSSKKTNEE